MDFNFSLRSLRLCVRKDFSRKDAKHAKETVEDHKAKLITNTLIRLMIRDISVVRGKIVTGDF